MQRRQLLNSSALAGITLLTIGCTSGDNSQASDDGSSYTQTAEPCGDESDYVGCEDGIKIISTSVEQRGSEVWATGEIKNISGKPFEYIDAEVEFVDETGQHIKTITDRVYALFHGEVWEYEIQMEGSLNEKRAISSASTSASSTFLDTRIPTTNPDACGDASEWHCDGRIRVASVNEGRVTTEHYGDEYMVYGEVENIGDEEIPAVMLAANYLESGNRIVAHRDGMDDVSSYVAPGETNPYRLSFGNSEPPGELSLRMYKTCATVDECM